MGYLIAVLHKSPYFVRSKRIQVGPNPSQAFLQIGFKCLWVSFPWYYGMYRQVIELRKIRGLRLAVSQSQGRRLASSKCLWCELFAKQEMRIDCQCPNPRQMTRQLSMLGRPNSHGYLTVDDVNRPTPRLSKTPPSVKKSCSRGKFNSVASSRSLVIAIGGKRGGKAHDDATPRARGKVSRLCLFTFSPSSIRRPDFVKEQRPPVVMLCRTEEKIRFRLLDIRRISPEAPKICATEEFIEVPD